MSSAISETYLYWSPYLLNPQGDYEHSLQVVSSTNLRRGCCERIKIQLLAASHPPGEMQPLMARLGDLKSKDVSYDGRFVEFAVSIPADYSLGEQSICIVFPADATQVCQIYREENVVLITNQEVGK